MSGASRWLLASRGVCRVLLHMERPTADAAMAGSIKYLRISLEFIFFERIND